jgi:hypothetical protein
VPLAPLLGRREHATLSAHVTKGTLAGAGVTTARDTGNTCDGTTSSPRLGRVLMTSFLGDGVGLPTVLVHVGVNASDDIISNGRGEHFRANNLLEGGVGGRDVDGMCTMWKKRMRRYGWCHALQQ